MLAVNLVSPINVPNYDNSAMDGYAFAINSFLNSRTLTVVGSAMAGAPYQGKCKLGECIRIMTGAKLPDNCDSVEMQENVQLNKQQATFLQEKTKGSHVRNVGEDIQKNQRVLTKGHRLSTIDIGILASLGIAKIQVYRPLNIALIATGDELKLPGQILNDGDIFASNSYFLAAILKKLNVNVIDFGVVNDDFDAIKKVIKFFIFYFLDKDH